MSHSSSEELVTIIVLQGLQHSFKARTRILFALALEVAVFFLVAVGTGAPPMLTIALLAYFSNLCGCLTNYSTGPVVNYFGLGYVESIRWFRIGFLVSLLHIAIWLGVGLPWWKFLGWW